MKYAILTAAAILMAAPVQAQDAGTTTAQQIDPKAYTGVWYEIARTPTPYEQQCQGGVTATYSLIDDTTVEVKNRCDQPSDETQSIVGTADVVNGNFNTFSVELDQTSGAPGINYVVTAVGDEEDGKYPWAAVHSPDGNTGWILARDPNIDVDTRKEAEAALKEVGVDLSQLSDTQQPPQSYDPSAE